MYGRGADKMNLWTSDYLVGVDALDSDHIIIFSLINHINESHKKGADEKTITRILEVLIYRALAHFQREEMLMQKNNYDGLKDHTEEHVRIITELQSLYVHYRDKPSPSLSDEIIGLLSSWLHGHIHQADMLYRPYVIE